MTVILNWLAQFNPFSIKDGRLISLSTGLATDKEDKINCDEAEKVGRSLHLSLATVAVVAAVVVRSLLCLSKGVTIKNEIVHIDPTVLFMRLIVLIERAEDMSDYFNYALAPIPCSLFKDNFMRHPNKSQLGEILVAKCQEISTGKKRPWLH